MQVTDLRPIPLLVRVDDVRRAGSADVVVDGFTDDLAVVYPIGAVSRGHLVSRVDLDRLGWSRRMLRQAALDTLYRRLDAVRVHGQPPALMLSFDGLESSLLLVDDVWDDLARGVPGDVVVGVPARDVVIVTGSQSPPGLERVRRAVDRMFYAHQRHPLTPHLMVRRGRVWEPLMGARIVRRAS